MEFRDYYKTLGVDRNASKEDIRSAYRKLARKHHPDVNKSPQAEDKFKQINEAYEVLKDDEKRKRYDAFGQNWKHGQDFQWPPPGGEQQYTYEGNAEEFAGFSDFFQSIFGGAFGRGPRGGFGGMRETIWKQRGSNHEAHIEITLAEAAHGTTKQIELEKVTAGPDGNPWTERVAYEVKIPAGVTKGSKIRLSGQGGQGIGGGASGDLYLRIHLRPDPRFRVNGHNLETHLDLAPWEAALGADVSITTLNGAVKLKVPPGTMSGTTLRLREKGLPRRKGAPGDLLVTTRIVVPKNLTSRERELFETLAAESRFKPRNS